METGAQYQPRGDQLALAAALERPLDDILPLSRLHASYEESAETWTALGELGLFGIALDPAQGGSGLGATEESLIAFGLGRRLVAPSVLATMALMHAPGASGYRGDRAAGAYLREGRVIVIADPEASLVLLRGGDETGVYEAPRSTLPLDRSLWTASLEQIVSLGRPLALFDRPRQLRLRLLDAAVLAGLAQASLDMAVAYAKLREQFGRPIGGFQAVKHHCANMAIAAQCARDQTTFAAVAVDEDREDAALQIECALLTTGAAAIENAAKNIQIHGGIGFSDEADPHLVLKRARLFVTLAGGLEAANQRVADIPACNA